MPGIQNHVDQLATITSLAERHGNAFFKVASPNDLGLTGSHQKGFYLPTMCWQYFTPHPPVKGSNSDHEVVISWDNGQTTQSCVKWYGVGTRSEYRLTRFNRQRDFYALLPEVLGAVICLIRTGNGRYRGFVIQSEEEIDGLGPAFGIDLSRRGWAILEATNPEQDAETQAANCQSARILELAAEVTEFPDTRRMSELSREVVDRCQGGAQSVDARLMALVDAEFELFRAIESRLYQAQVVRGFEGVDDFLTLAQTLTQRRKSRAGRSLESHVEQILREARIPFEAQPDLDDTQPDLVVPSAAAYRQSLTPDADVLVLAVKTTCRDRWRQVIKEAPRMNHRYLLTVQRGISSAQVRAISAAGITLVVPQALHASYAKQDRDTLMTVEEFVNEARHRYAAASG